MSMSTDVPGIGALHHRSATRITFVAVLTAVWLGWAAMLFGGWGTSDGSCSCTAESDAPAVELLQ